MNTREAVLRVIAEMRSDLAGTGSYEWENPDLERFPEALQDFLTDIDGHYANRGSNHPPNLTGACSPLH